MMCAIMFISTVAALSLTPMLCSQLLRLQKKQSRTFKLLFGPIEKGLDALDTAMPVMLNLGGSPYRPIVIFGCIVFFVVSLFCAKSIGTEFFPAQDNAPYRGSVGVAYRNTQGAGTWSLRETD